MSTDHISVGTLLREGRQRLERAGIESPALDAELVLRHLLNASREKLFMQLQEPLARNIQQEYLRLIEKRMTGYPVAYITGRRWFYGQQFIVSPAVLVPRPETEYLVDWALERVSRDPASRKTILDVGTGSGAIALSIADALPTTHLVIGSDVSMGALEIARKNGAYVGAHAEFVCGSLLDWFAGTADLIAANLPYLRPEQAHDGIRHEPPIALYAGGDGFALNRELIAQAAKRLATPGAMIMEIDPGQSALARETANHWFPDGKARIERDLAGMERYLILERVDGSEPARI